MENLTCFNPLDRGNLYQIVFISAIIDKVATGFNPLDRGNLYQIFKAVKFLGEDASIACFNPLDRGNLYLIWALNFSVQINPRLFQSPRSGKFVSDFSYC